MREGWFLAAVEKAEGCASQGAYGLRVAQVRCGVGREAWRIDYQLPAVVATKMGVAKPARIMCLALQHFHGVIANQAASAAGETGAVSSSPATAKCVCQSWTRLAMIRPRRGYTRD